MLHDAALAAERVGLFGGSFDPVHGGHLHVARVAWAARELEHVVFVPAARPPHKPGRELASAEARVAMLELALEELARLEPGLSSSIWTVELERSGPSFTIDTVRDFAERRSALPGRQRVRTAPTLILGSDNLPGLPQWRDVGELLALTEPLVVFRDGFGPEVVDGLDLSPEQKARLAGAFVSAPPDAASSSEVRAVLSSGGPLDTRDEIPARVAEYIRLHGLYRSEGGAAAADGGRA